MALLGMFVPIYSRFASLGARWPSGRVSDSGARGQGYNTNPRRVVTLSKDTLLTRKVLVIPRKRWLSSDMTEKLLTGTLSINKQTNRFASLRLATDHSKAVFLMTLWVWYCLSYCCINLVYIFSGLITSFWAIPVTTVGSASRPAFESLQL